MSEVRKPMDRLALSVAGVGLVLSWVPWLGLALSAVGLARAYHTRRRARIGLAMGIAVYGLVLGAVFTYLFLAFRPSEETPVERTRWDAFERLFHPDSGGSAGSGGGEGAL
ncbi:hypothetical protein [Vulgatibacter incomptus]|uniref:Uncharacterized protein n=1 Tax=Vulgatibacter incomptus TaxID=1391653 RepID=A0A0K1PAJ1_9BACT|nr:hypothetical protein [Vulgatibacter incomptus]AKU90535.1 hypothetical protein AKJ08_0922 [Vulgatibacter incomptus]